MISKEEIRFKAVKMGIATGQMSNADLIWAIQRDDLHTECFGGIADCHNRDCRWQVQCIALDAINLN
jgi:hypothetical protein